MVVASPSNATTTAVVIIAVPGSNAIFHNSAVLLKQDSWE
jgi:hypothetical protein